MNTNKRYKPFNQGLFTGLVEAWKDIPGFEGHYQISSFGRVKSLARLRVSRGGCLAPLREKILKPKTTAYGYLAVTLRREGKIKHPNLHRLVAEGFLPNKDSKLTVNHIDCDKVNNNVRNLEWSTHSEQMQHAVTNNLLEVRGEPKYSKAFKLQVYEYKQANTDCSISQLAVLFSISQRTAGRIVNEGVTARPTTRKLKDGTISVEPILTQQQVADIKLLRSQGWTFKELSIKFNRGLSQMHRVVNNLSRNSTIE
jgi:hypothetical protein